MPEGRTFILVTLCIIAFGLFSRRFARSVITPPMVFVLFGCVLSPDILGLSSLDLDSPAVHLLAELTLVLILFSDAARINLHELRKEYGIPVRLLAIAMPLIIILGLVTALWLFPELNVWEAALLAAVLAPTDAALSQPVVSNQKVPTRIRQAINVESGLNDGIALPVALFFASCANAAAGETSERNWVIFTAGQLILGPIVGAVAGYYGGKAIQWGERTKSMNHTFRQLVTLALGIFAFAAAEQIGGNGFIAAFVAGLTLGATARSSCDCVYDFAEVEGQLLALIAFLLFGTLMIVPSSEHWTPQVWIYAVLSLTLIRMVPAALSLIGLRLRRPTILFLGWFGPRGLASILFGLIVVERVQIPGRELIFSVMAATVFLSVILHGVTAYPAARRYAAYTESLRADEAAEHHRVHEHPVRIPFPH